ncbi:MAG: CRTAC1 family protein [Phycisphaeraceae bacterium]|nr:CRTAC1 family protein [Phycisphaeraceae bacterium]
MIRRACLLALCICLITNMGMCAGTGGVRSFADITKSAGISFKHHSGAFGKKYMPETMGAGCAFFDFNNDGLQDLLLVNGRDWPERKTTQTYTPALYQNQGNGTFLDITNSAGLGVEMYGMGCAVADYDNDGFNDIYLLNLGKNILFRNNGDGTCVNVTQTAGVGLDTWSTSCSWFDFDNDGWLDLFVGNYVNWSLKTDLWCTLDGTHKSYCTPESYQGVSPRLYRNLGNGTFEDVTTRAGILKPNAKTLGTVIFDLNEDGWLDIAVANDTEPDYLYQNMGNGTFMEVGIMSGIAFSETGMARAGMGMDVGDYENKGPFNLIVGNFTNEMIALFHNEGHGLFTDVAAQAQIGLKSLPFLTFGLFFFDFDLDGREDVFAVNGHVEDQIATVQGSITYAQPPLLFINQGNGAFQEIGATLGDAFQRPRVGRGAAYGDIDNDGDLDVLITANNGPPALLRNDGTGHNWMRFQLRGTKSNRSAIGARVKVYVNKSVQHKLVKAGNSYCSQSELVLTFGLGNSKKADRVEVMWPRGTQETFKDLTANRTYTLIETRGIQDK